MTELGSRLKEARKAKGLSLDDLQEITKIQKRYLRGIEEGNYDSIPGKFYVRAFIKQYAEAIGLESDRIFEEFKNDVPVTHNQDITEQISRVQSRSTVSEGTSIVFSVLPTILVVVFVVAFVFLIWIVVQKYSGSGQADKQNNSNSSQVRVNESGKSSKTNSNNNNIDNNQTNPNEETNSDSKNDDSTNTEEKAEPVQKLKVVSSSGKNSTFKLSNTDKFNLTISSSGKTWILVNNGKGKTYYQGTLNKGDNQSLDFTQEDQAFIIIGNVPDTEILVNDQKLEYASQLNTQNITIQFEQLKTE